MWFCRPAILSQSTGRGGKGLAGTNSSCDEVGILAVCRVPVAAVENADHVVVHGREGLEEADESMFIVDLFPGWRVSI
jgi:hypothetical protein